jgi:hypothetical protein
VLFGLLMQYAHGVFTQLAHRLHQPSPEPLRDIGFQLTPVGQAPPIIISLCAAPLASGSQAAAAAPLLPPTWHCPPARLCLQELGPGYHWASEWVFLLALLLFTAWSLSPFLLATKRFYTAVLWSRVLVVLTGELEGWGGAPRSVAGAGTLAAPPSPSPRAMRR